MDFSEVIGHQHIKSHLVKTVQNGRIPHAQLFSGVNGSGLLPMAIAYASEVLSSQYEKGSAEYISCRNKVSKLMHPDLHFVYPVNTSDIAKKNAISDNYAEGWRNFVLNNPYASLFEWLQSLGLEKKQGNISKYEAENISKKLSLKAFEGGYKVMIIWMADNMNSECANKILKLVEEPSEKTLLLLLTEREEQIISTIRSRCQKLTFPLLSETDIAAALTTNLKIKEQLAAQLARRARGDYNKALQLQEETGEDEIFEKWFISWVRTAFRAKGNKGAINNLLDWSDELASQGRETQKKFFNYCIEVFRQALLKNYSAEPLLFFEAKDATFSLPKFAPFVHQNNIFGIISALEDASYHIERNGNAKIIFTDLSIKLTRLIHQPELA
ncbi:DNA polymerase III subunit [Aequorivita vladivostokensis]|uniref:DNA polymerase III subunit delta n=1 Tax=Aequorivita vladivostokensis TaxID=171194 RepID=A0ABR5DIN1_9FLAO|nr:DNA polymerase III subunit delta' [Aequorivita vladivostokensis]KJJ38644.1 DNA polymerase III subunit delta' [Aequorivita vladivostokensis]